MGSTLSEMHTCLPGKVTAYDPVTNTAVVKPGVKLSLFASDGSRHFEDPIEIPFVPVIFPRAGGMVLRLPVDVGDPVLLVFAESSLAEWRESGEVSEPADARRFSLGWPVAILGFYPDVDPPSPIDAVAVAGGAAIFGQDGGKQVRVSSTGVEISQAGAPAVSPVALAIPTDAGIAGAIAAVNALSSIVSSLLTAYNGHTHAVATTGTAAAQAGTAAATTSTISSVPATAPAAATTASLLTKSL